MAAKATRRERATRASQGMAITAHATAYWINWSFWMVFIGNHAHCILQHSSCEVLRLWVTVSRTSCLITLNKAASWLSVNAIKAENNIHILPLLSPQGSPKYNSYMYLVWLLLYQRTMGFTSLEHICHIKAWLPLNTIQKLQMILNVYRNSVIELQLFGLLVI